jgi:hypothetical protein
MGNGQKSFQIVETEGRPVRHAPNWSLNGRENVVPKNGPFSLTFCQMVALILPHRSE